MRKKPGLLAVAWLGAIMASTVAFAQSEPPTEPANPQWASGPSASVDFDDWPEQALRQEKSGTVVLKCAYDQNGVLSDCKVMKESPKELGFGLAARALSRKFRLKPTLSDGSPLTPGEITFEAPFILENVRM